ncbi:MAG: NDP-sugar synthase [Dehalococcoidales bacterium]|jgi:mannose-1-phosphate guanylyltransferase|nr:NDP-sugar synthase [Dehalococcoidales bacterium]MDP6738332.1 NDP-sugar synthase [Dehalococcoidales bacterium]|tara:strand:+ start:4710 stop:5804 length:1095 start_codon:yes stop_codon:yes gene_type:complete
MKAVILVGGKATRLLPLTSKLPKALVPVLNIPFLEYVICHLRRHRITEIILALGNLAEPIESYFSDGSRFGVKLSYIVEKTPYGTAGGIKNAEKFLDESFIVLNGDVFTDLDITAMMAFHYRKKALVTIALACVDDPTSYGVIVTDAEGRVSFFREKPALGEVTSNMINAGTYILEPSVLAQIFPGIEVSIEREVFPSLLAQGAPVYAYTSSAYWLDIGTHGKYLQLHRDLLNGKCHQHVLDLRHDVLIGAESNLHPSAQIMGPVVIGASCFIGREVKLIGPSVIGAGGNIMANSVVDGSIIWPNTWIGPGVNVKNSILANRCFLHANSVVEESVLGDNVIVCDSCRLKSGSRIFPGAIVGAET